MSSTAGWAAMCRTASWPKFLTAPGLWMQNFTTNEPDDTMIECAIRSLELVLPDEKGKDAVVTITEILLPQPAKRLRKKKEEQGSERSFRRRRKRSSADLRRRMAITYNDLFLDIRRELKQGGGHRHHPGGPGADLFRGQQDPGGADPGRAAVRPAGAGSAGSGS